MAGGTSRGAAGERGVWSALGRVAGGAVLVVVGGGGVLCGTGVGRRGSGVWVEAGHGEKEEERSNTGA